MEEVKTATLGRWEKLCAAAGAEETHAGWHGRVIRAWKEPHRHYHNLEHLEDCLRCLDEVTHLCENAVTVEFALWFHDVIYDPKAPDNEERSAGLACTFLRQVGLGSGHVSTVESLILATKTHVPGTEPDAGVMLDIDLSILGHPRTRFARYEADIRHEYAWVPADVFAQKRAAILESFLTRNRIYQTPWFQERFESLARENLAWAVEELHAASITPRGQRDVAP